MTVLRNKSGDVQPTVCAKIVVHTQSSFRQAVMMNLIEDLLKGYPEIARYVLTSEPESVEQFELEFGK